MLDGFGRPAVVRIGTSGAWCVAWPEEGILGRAAWYAFASLPSDSGSAVPCACGMSVAFFVCCQSWVWGGDPLSACLACSSSSVLSPDGAALCAHTTALCSFFFF